VFGYPAGQLLLVQWPLLCDLARRPDTIGNQLRAEVNGHGVNDTCWNHRNFADVEKLFSAHTFTSQIGQCGGQPDILAEINGFVNVTKGSIF
jgi:hypothetical protein